jgi:hypothetical protein
MGSIKRFNIDANIKKFDIKYFFETGTWRGDGLAYAARYNFEKLFSIEIMPEIAEEAKGRFKHDKRINIFTGSSHTIFPQLLSEIHGNTMFWLDAHYPGAEEGLKGYNEHNQQTERLPLEAEIEIIFEQRKEFSDLIIIDDLRIYEDGPFESGNIPNNINVQNGRNLDFISKAFGQTHSIERLFANEGYIIVAPRKIIGKPSIIPTLFNKIFRHKIY